MGLQRVGLLCGTLGLTVVLLTAIVLGPAAGGTEVHCPDHEPSYGLAGVDVGSLSVSYTDGCNTFALQPLITGGVGLTGLGVVFGLFGVGRASVNIS
ncbi:MAG: hypothetical protein J07HN4v3_01980 [Halonotius sp. J07HN4]|jgi:hypothetical protein|nr:MAG: hypothetical protein J07HN4v3_01980 [Halonotius sp. J07HN4]